MTQPGSLLPKIALVRRRLRRLLALYGLSHWLAIALATLIVAGCGDYLLRFKDPGIRLIYSVLAAAMLLWAAKKYLGRNLLARWSDAELARRIQRSLPGLDDRLLSAVEFLRADGDDPALGSPVLRRAVVAQTAAATEHWDFRRVLDPRPAIRALLLALCMVAMAGALLAFAPEVCRTALARLVHPLGTRRWPQATYLTYRKRVEQVARGQAFEIEVIDARGAPLPLEVRIHYRFGGSGRGGILEEQPMRFLGGAMVARRDNVTQPFEYRVEGGDDQSQPWTAVSVVEPPAVESLSVRLIPPAYTSWPAAESDREIRALVGTRLEFRGKSTKPLRSGKLVLEGSRPLPLVLDDADHFHLPAEGQTIEVRKSLSYRFALIDQQGLESAPGDQWEIRAVPDLPPSVSIEEPSADLYVTAAATVPLEILAKDDLAIRSVGLGYSRSSQPQQPSPPEPIYVGPAQAPPGPGISATGSNPPGESRRIEHRWNLASLKLRPGETVSYWAEAGDYRPGTGRSEPRRLQVIAPESLLERIAAREGLILSELSRVLKMQRESRAQLASLAAGAEQAGRLEQLDVDHLQAAALEQRQVGRALTSRGEGVPLHVSAVLADLDNNKIDNPELRRRMQGLSAELDRIDRQHLAPLEQQFTVAIKAAQVQLAGQPSTPSPAADPLLKAALTASLRQQEQIVAAVQALLAQLGRWEHYRRFHGEMAQLGREQEELTQRTAELARATLGRDLGDLLPQQRAELQSRAQEQLDLAEHLDQLLDDMQRSDAPLAERDRAAAETVRRTLDEAQRQGVSGQMRQARGEIQQNRVGEAIPRQKQLVESLRGLAAILGGKQPPQLSRLEEGVQQLHARQEQLIAQTRQLPLQPPSLGRWTPQEQTDLADIAQRQHALQEQTARLAEDFAIKGAAFRLTLSAAARTMDAAARRLDQHAADALTRNLQQQALERLALLRGALQPDATQGRSSSSSSNAAGPKPSPSGRAEVAAELKLIKLLQQSLNARTQSLAHVEPDRDEVRQQYRAISEEQGSLAEAILQLSREEPNEPEEPRQ